MLTNEDRAEIKAIVEKEVEKEVVEKGIVQNLVHELRQPLSTMEAIAYYLEMVLPADQEESRGHMQQLQALVSRSNALLGEAFEEVLRQHAAKAEGERSSPEAPSLPKRGPSLAAMPAPSDVVMRITARAIEVLGSQEKALRWLKTSVRSLGDRSPLSLLSTSDGIAAVEDALGRIEHGVW